MKLELKYYGDPALREKSEPVEQFDGELSELADRMIEFMREHRGVGLAAQQVGRTEALCVIDIPADMDVGPDGERLNPNLEMPLRLVNPNITVRSEEKDTADEGCLSFPGIYVPVTRSRSITLSYRDVSGAEHTADVSGLAARAVQHELDHLDGLLVCDRVSQLKRIAVSGKFKRLRRQTREKLGIK